MSDVEALTLALAEHDRMQRESDHRVKNTLQLISSIILLQGRRAKDEAARQALKDVQQRVSVVSVAHRHVVRDGEHEQVDATALVREVATDLAASAREGVSVALDLEALTVPARDGAPLALWLCEALSNAVRHAYPDGRGGQVHVALRREAGGFELSVADDGVGPPEGGFPTGFGNTILALMAQQLRGRLETAASQPGYRAAVHVTVKEAAP